MSGACRQPLSSIRLERPVGPTTNILRATCHDDCTKHCVIETKTDMGCKDTVAAPAPCADGVATQTGVYGAGCWTGLCMFFIWFLIIFAITFVVLWLLKPAWVLRPLAVLANNNGTPLPANATEVDIGKVVLYAALIALVIIIIVWLIRTFACGGRYF